MNKKELREMFSKDYEKHYKLDIFTKEGFTRQKCKKCGSYFWSIAISDTCGDSNCEPYSFFKKDWKKGDYLGMWKKFALFFKKNGHEEIERYPVLARWRGDLHFTIASIVDFMRLEQGKVVWEYPENPLIVPQMCLRFPDISNVGITGRHHTSFIMAGQHTFLDGNKHAYWKEKCIELNYKCLTEVIGVKKEDLRYKEDVWAMPDLSSFGACIETFANGVELVNSVFTEYTKQKDEIKELPMKVIDVGWGFERLVWYMSGAPTSYDANLGYAVEYMIKKSKIKYDKELQLKYATLAGQLDIDDVEDIKKTKKKVGEELGISYEEIEEKLAPIEAIYAIADHTKTLVFALADGGLPSNVGGGYNLRIILRRAKMFIDKYNYPFTLEEIANVHINYLKEMFPELENTKETMKDIFDNEIEKYNTTVEKARRRVEELSKKGKITEEILFKEYESNGVTPEIIMQVAKENNLNIEIPEDFYVKLTERHIFNEKKEEKIKYKTENLPETEMLYYEGYIECESEVLDVKENVIVLDKTCFYPEGGGQIYDKGTINENQVKEVYKYENVIFHVLKENKGIKKGDKVYCKVDGNRRMSLMRHHTATHLVAGIARQVLGKHIWQAGASKDVDKATLDITHYKNITQEEIDLIEREANKIVLGAIDVEIKEYDRGEAEKKYGFTLYQGGGSPGKKVRVIKVGNIDVEACGGLHVENTSLIGSIKIIKTERIQDGVVRLTYCAGEAAVNYIQKIENYLKDSCNVFSVNYNELPKTCERFFNEWKEKGKTIEHLQEKMVEIESEKYKNGIYEDLEMDNKTMVKIANKNINEENWVALINKQGFVVVGCAPKTEKNAKEEMNKIFEKKGKGKGGGNETLAQGKIN
jgi:alanyl-tRNA synthetase